MKRDVTKKSKCSNGSCTSANAQSLWLIGIAVTVLVTLFCLAMFKTNNRTLPVQDAGQEVMVMPAGQQAAFTNNFGHPTADQMIAQWKGGGQQVALANPNCATCPNFTNCFPQGTGGAQQVALANPNCATCPNFTNCFPQGTGGAQQVALANPNCATCPNFTNCFPQGTTGGQQVAWGQGRGLGSGKGLLNCPFCKFVYNDSNFWNRGFSRCPNCQGLIPLVKQPMAGGFTTIALTKPIVAPPIFRDAVMPHDYRGVCENCHIIKPDIAILATAQMPHEYRGVCSNCHTILGTKAGAQ